MDKLLAEIQSPVWWFSVVVVGVLVNVLSAYLKPHLDRAMGAWSTTRREKQGRAAERRERWIAAISKDKHEELHFYLYGLTQLVFSLLLLVMSTVIMTMSGGFAAYFSTAATVLVRPRLSMILMASATTVSVATLASALYAMNKGLHWLSIVSAARLKRLGEQSSESVAVEEEEHYEHD